MVDTDCVPGLKTREKNPYEYFPYFPPEYSGHEPEYKTVADRHALMFPERPHVRRNWYERGPHHILWPVDEYFLPGKAKYPVLVQDRDNKDGPTSVPNLEIRKRNRLEYFPDFTHMTNNEFRFAVRQHARRWPHRPKIVRRKASIHNGWDKDEVIYEGDPYPVLIAYW